jgi:hypothetical protein
MDLAEFVILISVLVWIGTRIRPVREQPTHGWKHTLVNLSGFDNYDQVEHRLDEIGRWGRELVLIWVPPDDPERPVFGIFKEPIPHGYDEKLEARRARLLNES